MSFGSDMNRSKLASEKSLDTYNVALAQYHGACARFDFKAADLARAVIEGSLQSYLDHVAAQYLRLQEAQR